jgi:hypothetical protein
MNDFIFKDLVIDVPPMLLLISLFKLYAKEGTNDKCIFLCLRLYDVVNNKNDKKKSSVLFATLDFLLWKAMAA